MNEAPGGAVENDNVNVIDIRTIHKGNINKTEYSYANLHYKH